MCAGGGIGDFGMQGEGRKPSGRKGNSLPSATSSWWSGLSPVQRHDALNLAVLPIIAAMSISALFWHDLGFYVIRTLMSYMAVDAMYIASNPACVPSWKLVLFHHFVSVLGLSHGIIVKSDELLVSSYALIEVGGCRTIRGAFRCPRAPLHIRLTRFHAHAHSSRILLRLSTPHRSTRKPTMPCLFW